MVIFKECKHFFQIVQALFPKSASTLVFYVHKGDCPFCVQKLRTPPLRCSVPPPAP